MVMVLRKIVDADLTRSSSALDGLGSLLLKKLHSSSTVRKIHKYI